MDATKRTGINTEEKGVSDVVSGEEKFCNDMNQILSTASVGFEDSSNADIENETGRPLVATADPVTELGVAHAVPVQFAC